MLDAPETAKLIGYARVSTEDQDLSLQVAALKRFGVAPERIMQEHASGKTMNRPVWSDLMKQIQPGDTVVIWKLDRMGRTLIGLLETIEQLADIGADICTVDGQIDTATAMGRFFVQVMGAVAELERGLISERTKAGIAVKKAQGVKFGARHMIRDNPKRLAAARKLHEKGILETLTARELQAILNAADLNAKPIGHINTVRIWVRARYPGL